MGEAKVQKKELSLDERAEISTSIINAFKYKNIVLIAKHFLTADEGHYVVCSDALYKYDYDMGIYSLLDGTTFDRAFLNFCTQNKADNYWTPVRSNEIYRTIGCMPDVPRIEQFDNYDSLICLKNGILDLDSEEFVPHSPNFYFISRIELTYAPEDKNCPNFLGSLQTTFTLDSGEPDNETIQTILQILAYFIYPKIMITQMFFFGGEGSNGKSIMQNILKMMFGKFSVLSMSQMSDPDGHARVKLVGSRINISTETRNKEIDSEEIKNIVGGEEININPKNKQPFDYKPNVKLITSGNHNVFFGDTTKGIYRRFVPIEFRNTFCDPEELEGLVEPQKLRKFPKIREDILEKGFKAEELAILNLLLVCLKQLRANNWVLKLSKEAKRTREEYKLTTDNIGTWLGSTFAYNPNEFDVAYSFSELYNIYEEWHRENISNVVPHLTAHTFTKKMKGLWGNFKGMETVYDQEKRTTVRKFCLKVKKNAIENELITLLEPNDNKPSGGAVLQEGSQIPKTIWAINQRLKFLKDCLEIKLREYNGMNLNSPFTPKNLEALNKEVSDLEKKIWVFKHQKRIILDLKKDKKEMESKGEVWDEAEYNKRIRTLVSLEELKEISIINYLTHNGVKVLNSSSKRKKCCCPIHNEKSPSFVIYEDNNSFYCFGCHVGGSILDLVMAVEKVSLEESIKLLANVYRGL